jgi:hypothetical protein
MKPEEFSALVSVISFLWAKRLNALSLEGLNKSQREARSREVNFYTLLGASALFLSFWETKP